MTDLMMKKLTEGRQYRDMRTLALDENSQIVHGYACTFDDPYDLYEDDYLIIREQIDRHAFDGTDLSDVIMQYNHEGRVYARASNNTLDIRPDEHGLMIRADLGGTTAGRELYEEIKGGYTTKMSFGFVVCADRTDRSSSDDNKRVYLRTITKVKKLYDVSAVALPANGATEISARSFIDGVIERDKLERLEAEARERKIRELRLRLRLKGVKE